MKPKNSLAMSLAVLAATALVTAPMATVQAELFHGHATKSIVLDDPCCGKRCVEYVNHPKLLGKKCCVPMMETVVLVEDCQRCCTVAIPVCVPACCTGVPKVTSRKAIFGRGVAHATWCCGHKLKIVFDKCGDVTVHSHG